MSFPPSPSDSHHKMEPEPHKINNVEGDQEGAVIHIDEDIYTIDADADVNDQENTGPRNSRPVKVSLDAALALIPKNTQSESKQLLLILRSVVQDVYNHLPWDETRPKNKGGIYTGVQKRKRRTRANAQTTNYELDRKFGMSLTNVRKRTCSEQQPYLMDIRQLLDKNAASALICDEHVKKVMALKLPGLCFHETNQESLRLLIKLQLAEMAYACIYGTKDIVCERLTQVPDHDVWKAVKKHTFSADAIREGT